MYIITILMNPTLMKTPILRRDNFLKMMIVKVQAPMRMMKKIFLRNKMIRMQLTMMMKMMKLVMKNKKSMLMKTMRTKTPKKKS